MDRTLDKRPYGIKTTANQGRKRLGDKSSVTEENGVAQCTGLDFVLTTEDPRQRRLPGQEHVSRKSRKAISKNMIHTFYKAVILIYL